MAGAGYKLFNTGDVLTAAQVNTYLMQQSVMSFASAAARTTAISGILAEGMVTYLQDTNSLEYYDGSAWVAAVGDITGVTAGTGLSGGGTSGAVTLSINTAVTADLTTAQTLTNKKLSDSTTTIVDVTDATKAIKFDVNGTTSITGTIATNFTTAKTLSLPDATDTLVGLATTDTLTNKTLTSPTINDPKLNLTLNAQTGTTYTFVLADNGKLITASNASAQTYSIPTNASVAFPVGTQINLIQIGAGQVTVSATTPGTTTILSNAATAAGPKCRVQYSALTAIKVATDSWYVIGDIA